MCQAAKDGLTYLITVLKLEREPFTGVLAGSVHLRSHVPTDNQGQMRRSTFQDFVNLSHVRSGNAITCKKFFRFLQYHLKAQVLHYGCRDDHRFCQKSGR